MIWIGGKDGKRMLQGITSQKGGEVIGNIYENPDLIRENSGM